jgi:prepilin signal peptidase PulO-like enzyme (type II secretory pathway)
MRVQAWAADTFHVESLLFFLLGLPAAVIADRLVVRLSEPDVEDEGEEYEPDARELARKPLPWHEGSWPTRTRLAIVALIPLLMGVAGWRFEAPQAAAVSFLLCALVVCTATDLLRYRVPNAVTYPCTMLALLATALMPDANPLAAGAAALLGGACFLAMAVLTRGGLGLGDVKLAVLIGAALGPAAAYQALMLGVVAGGIVIFLLLALGVVGRKQAVPYAPFLALGAIAMVLVRGAAFAPL